MGFYGNISSVNKSTFQFDKIYPNRYEMDSNADNDDIFIGRYALVDYDQPVSDDTLLSLLKNQENLDRKHFIVGYEILTWAEDSENPGDIDYRRSSVIEIADGASGEHLYNFDDLESFIAEGKTVYCFVPWTLHKTITPEDVTIEMGDKIYLLYQAVIEDNELKNWIDITDDSNIENLVENNFSSNFRKDVIEYGSVGRGWDSTVWQKTYKYNEATKENQPTYVMIAELNSVVPTFDVTTDAPTEMPLKPHYDTDTSNLYYKLHMQPSWGMRVRAAENSEFSIDTNSYVEDGNPVSDVTGDYIVDQKLVYNGSNQHIIEQKIQNKDLAIYFNRKGFDKLYPHEWHEYPDIINVKPTGLSPNTYYASEIRDEETGEVIREASVIKQQYPDTYELSMILPSIGNTVSKIWDIAYGEGQIEDALGKILWDSNLKKFASDLNPMRNTAIEWNTFSGNRLTNRYNPYNPKALNSMAGIINTVHDLMGMIIIEKDFSAEDIQTTKQANPQETGELNEDYEIRIKQILLDEVSKNWDPEKIYYYDGKYYYKSKVYNFSEYNPVEGISGGSIIDLTDGEMNPPEETLDNNNEYIFTESYFRIAEEEYDDYSESEVQKLINKNYYKVKNYDNIIPGAQYASIKLRHVPNLQFNGYQNYSEDEESSILYYNKKDDNGNRYIRADIENTEKNPITDAEYYRIKFEPISTQTFYYVPNVYWLGSKTFTDKDVLIDWIDKKTDLSADDFDNLHKCTENSFESVLALEGISLPDGKTIEQILNDETIDISNGFTWYKILLNVSLDTEESRWVLKDLNSILETCEQESATEEENKWVKIDSRTGSYYLEFAGQQEILQNVGSQTIIKNSTSIDVYNYYACRYFNRKKLVNGIVDENDIRTLKQWKEWGEDQELEVNDSNFDLVKSTRYERVIAEPAYTLTDATEITLTELGENEEINYYYHPLSSTDTRPSETSESTPVEIADIYIQETLAGLDTEQGRARIEAGNYFEITEKSDVSIFFNPADSYYYKDSLGNYLKENNKALQAKANQVLANDYYRLEDEAIFDGYAFVPGLYRKIVVDENNSPIINENGEITTEIIEEYGEIINNDIYQLYEDRYVISDELGIFNKGAYWNPMVSVPVEDNEPLVKLGKKTESWGAKELTDFGNILNTINGLILKINQKLLDGDLITRDQNTVQGAINTLNDIIAKFNTLIPAEIVMVDTYGRIHSGDWDSKQKSSNAVGAAPATPAGEPDAEDNERWIKMTTTSGTNENNFKPHIKLEHMFRAGTNTTSTSNLNTDNEASNNDSDKMRLYTPILDNMGHVVAKNIETVTLPYGFKSITTGQNNTLIANNTQDDISITGDNWTQIIATNTTGSNQGDPTRGLAITHTGPVVVAERGIGDLTPAFGSLFTIEDWKFDEKGHEYHNVNGVETHTIKIPGLELVTHSSEIDNNIVYDSGNILTNIEYNYDDTTHHKGTFTKSLANISSLDLAGYRSEQTNNPLISFTDTINSAFETIVTILDNNNTSVNTRIGNAITTAIADLNADLDAGGTPQHEGIFVISGVTEANGKLTAVDSIEVESAGKAENVYNRVIGTSTDEWDDYEPIYNWHTLKDYVDKKTMDGVYYSDALWGLKAMDALSSHTSITGASSKSYGLSDYTTIPLSSTDSRHVHYGNIQGAYEDFNTSIHGIKIKQDGMYRIQGSIALGNPNNVSYIHAGVFVVNSENLTENTKIIQATEGFDVASTNVRGIFPLSATIVDLTAGDVICLGVDTEPDKIVQVLSNNVTYLLIEKISGGIHANIQQNTEPEEPENNGGGE